MAGRADGAGTPQTVSEHDLDGVTGAGRVADEIRENIQERRALRQYQRGDAPIKAGDQPTQVDGGDFNDPHAR